MSSEKESSVNSTESDVSSEKESSNSKSSVFVSTSDSDEKAESEIMEEDCADTDDVGVFDVFVEVEVEVVEEDCADTEGVGVFDVFVEGEIWSVEVELVEVWAAATAPTSSASQCMWNSEGEEKEDHPIYPLTRRLKPPVPQIKSSSS